MVVKDNKEVVKFVRKLLDDKFPDDIAKVILFDPQVLGKSAKRNDYDLLVILKNDYTWEKADKIMSLGYEADLEFDIITDIKVISFNELQTFKGKQIYIREAITNGVGL